MQWDEFLAKTKIAKKMKQTKGLNVGCITKLIFAGVFDGMLPNVTDNPIALYTQMYEDIKKTLGSKAMLPKKSKTQVIGISDIKNPLQLAFWRYQVNPLKFTPILKYLDRDLKDNGFNPRPHDKQKYFQYTKFADKENPVFVSTNPDVSLDMSPETTKRFTNRGTKGVPSSKYLMGLCGILSKVEYRKFGSEDKEMVSISLFTGERLVDNIIKWPSYHSHTIDESFRALAVPGNLVRLTTQVSIKDNKYKSYKIVFATEMNI
jgi:hypothetical protein